MRTPPSTGLARTVRTARSDVSGIVAVVVEAIATALPDLAAEPGIGELLGETAADTIAAGMAVLSGEADLETVHAPEPGLALARKLAQQNVPLPVMLRAYRLGQAAFQQEMITRVAAQNDNATEIADAARDLSSTTFTFVDHVAEEVVTAYQAERDGWMQRRNAARLARITTVLAAQSGADTELERALGYPLAPTHLAAVLWTGPGGDEAALERQAATIGTALGCRRPPLVVFADSSSMWAWFPAPAQPAEAATVADGIHAAFGEPGRGVAGFRRSHQQARQAQLVVAAAHPADRPGITTPHGLGPLILLALEPAAVGPWVRAVLGGLARDDADTAELRHTVWTYLDEGGSLAGAASRLHLHRNTIQYRLHKAERVRGRPLDDDRLAMEVALLACRTLGAAVLAER